MRARIFLTDFALFNKTSSLLYNKDSMNELIMFPSLGGDIILENPYY
jgi:hypothetical protein